MDVGTKLLLNYYGRDRIIRTVTYLAMLGAGRAPPPTAQKLATIVTQLSGARTVLRLFDDLLMYRHITGYGWGKQEKNPLLRCVTVFNNLTDTLFFPIEHIAWLAEHKIIPIEAKKWWVAGISMWASSLTSGIIKNLLTLKRLQRRRGHLRGLEKLEGADGGTDATETLSSLKAQERICKITILKNLADLLNAVNWLPAGFLWAGKFSMSWTGLFGLISSLLGLRLTLMAPPPDAKKSA